jgi:ATP-dependent Clp protease ATP-binding subunit ClpA
MFERFTERARHVVVSAQAEARELRHGYVGTEHILLGLLREDEGLAASVLMSLGVTLERVRGQVVRIVGIGEEVTSGQIPFTPRAKRIFELALREALRLGHNYIGTEHILLALTDTEGVAVRIMLDFDADAETVREEIGRRLSGPSGQQPPGAGRPGPMSRRAGAASGTSDLQLDSRARLAIELAKREALTLGAQEVGTEHILLGLQLSGEGLAARVLEHAGVTIERARPLIVTITGAGEPRPFGEIALTPAASQAIAGAAGEALKLGAETVATEHLLLSLIGHYEGVLGRVLLDLGADPQQIRREVLRMSSSPVGRHRGPIRLHTRPGLHWERATLLWRPEGVELRVPLRLSVDAMAAFAADEVWSTKPFVLLRREIWNGWLALASPSLLEEAAEPQELRRALDEALLRALETGGHGDTAASEFLNRLREEPPG